MIERTPISFPLIISKDFKYPIQIRREKPFFKNYFLSCNSILQIKTRAELKTLREACWPFFTIDMWIKKRTAIFVSLMSWHIPKFNKEIPFRITFDVIRRATGTSISGVLQKRSRRNMVKTKKLWIPSKLLISLKKQKIIDHHLHTNCTPDCLSRATDGRTFNN